MFASAHTSCNDRPVAPITSTGDDGQLISAPPLDGPADWEWTLANLTRRVDGIDVFQSNDVNWPGVADLGVSIGIAKAWQEGDFEDTRFREFWPAMRNAGLIRGAYLLLAPQRDLSRDDIRTRVQHFTDRIDAVGGLEPGDLPPFIDYEGDLPPGGTPAARKQRALDQLAWALIELTPYVQRVTRRPELLPFVYTGRSTWLTNLHDPTAADAAAFVTSDGDALDFTRFPLWWAWLLNNNLDPLSPTDLATILYPKAWPGPRNFYLQYSGGVPFPPPLGGQPTHDASVIAAVDATNRLSVPTDFSPILKLASVAPPTADVLLSRVTELSDQPPDQVFSLLLIGQGFWPDEFPQIVQQGLFGRFDVYAGPLIGGMNVHARQGVADIAPLNLLAAAGGRNAMACYFDPGSHPDGTGVALPLRQERVRGTGLDPITGNPVLDPTTNAPITDAPIDALRISHITIEPPEVVANGRSLADYLSHLTVQLADGSIHRATEYWPAGERRTGPKGALVAVLRRAPFLTHNASASVPDDPRPAELYQLDPTTEDQLPFIAVNVVPGGDWPLVLARAIAQNLAGLSDEYELEGDGFAQPPDGVVSPLAPNVLAVTDTQRQALRSGGAASATAPEAFTAWSIPQGAAVDFVEHSAASANPIPAWNGFTQSYGLGDFHLVEGGAGFRTHVVRCDRDCLMRRIPAQISGTLEPAGTRPPALPIQSTMRVFCKACEARLRSVITGRIGVTLEPRVEIDSQRRLFDSIAWQDRTEMPIASVALTSQSKANAPAWSCAADFSGASFAFTDISLSNVDYWASVSPPHVAHVLQRVAFEGLRLTFADGTVKALSVADGLTSATMPPRFAVSLQGDARGRYQLGACLSLSWLATHSAKHTCVVEAKLSLVLASMNSDIDPAGIMVGCRLYPQIAIRVRSATPGTKAVKSLEGTVTLVANNADPSTFTMPIDSLLTGRLTTSLFCESNRAAVDGRKRSALGTALVPGIESLLPAPCWSQVYDYVNLDVSGTVAVAAVHARSEGALGTTARDGTKTWPPGLTTTETVHKLPRQGAYDSLCIHPDFGLDAKTRRIIAAPICADFALHMHWRRGASWAGGPAPRNIFRGWGAGRLAQGAHSVLGAPGIPPNQQVNVEVTPAANRSTVTVKYKATATEVSAGRWNVFLEQGLAFAFQYAIQGAVPWQIPSMSFGEQAWLAASVGAGQFDDIRSQLKSLDGQANPLDAAMRTLWASIWPRLRYFDQTADGSADEQVPAGPSDAASLENL